MNLLSALVALAVASRAAAEQDPYQAVGQAVGSIFRSIGSVVSESTYNRDQLLSAQSAGRDAIGSLRVQVSTYDWNAILGKSVASIYTSQLAVYIDNLNDANEQLGALATAAPAAAYVAGSDDRPIKAVLAASVSASASASATPTTSAPARTFETKKDASTAKTDTTATAASSRPATTSEAKSQADKSDKSDKSEDRKEPKTDSSAASSASKGESSGTESSATHSTHASSTASSTVSKPANNAGVATAATHAGALALVVALLL